MRKEKFASHFLPYSRCFLLLQTNVFRTPLWIFMGFCSFKSLVLYRYRKDFLHQIQHCMGFRFTTLRPQKVEKQHPDHRLSRCFQGNFAHFKKHNEQKLVVLGASEKCRSNQINNFQIIIELQIWQRSSRFSHLVRLFRGRYSSPNVIKFRK